MVLACFRRMLFDPTRNIRKAELPQSNITPVIGKAVLLLSALTMAVAKAPIPSCTAPISAEAVPAFLENGDKASAEVFGKTKPCVAK